MTDDLIQGSPEWLAARAGSLGASQMADMLAKTKTGWGASRTNLKARLITERLTGQPVETFTNAAMEWGKQQEDNARSAYEFVTGNAVTEIGLRRHPEIEGTHASPDGMIGPDGCLEIKCPNSATHIDTLLTEAVADKYVKQMQWQMRILDRKWCDFVSFDPRMPVEMQIFITRILRDDAMIAEMEREAIAFLAEVSAAVADLRGKFMKEAA